jgi:hypothetical protein
MKFKPNYEVEWTTITPPYSIFFHHSSSSGIVAASHLVSPVSSINFVPGLCGYKVPQQNIDAPFCKASFNN